MGIILNHNELQHVIRTKKSGLPAGFFAYTRRKQISKIVPIEYIL